MEENFLQELLRTGLFDIGESDERLNWLKKAIVDVQKKFGDNYTLLPKYTLVALDPNISDKEPVLIETEKIITNHWEGLRVRFSDMPRSLIRGVILNALYNVGKIDPLAARIIWFTGLNFFPYAKLNLEKRLVEGMLNTIGAIAEKNAVEEWSLIEEVPSLKLGSLKVSGLQFNPVIINSEDLKNKLISAASPGVSQHGNPTGFAQHFGVQSSNAITELLNLFNSEISKGLSTTTLEASINKFFTEFKKALDANLKTSVLSLNAIERRSKLLWWKETLYSASQKVSYRRIDKNLLPIVMSADLSNQVPKVTPISVDYLLRDTLFILNNKQDDSISFSEYLSEISKKESKSILKSYFPNVIESEGRISISDFISLLVNDRVGVKSFKMRTGIHVTEKITYTDLSVVLLHDLLTQRLIS